MLQVNRSGSLLMESSVFYQGMTEEGGSNVFLEKSSTNVQPGVSGRPTWMLTLDWGCVRVRVCV